MVPSMLRRVSVVPLLVLAVSDVAAEEPFLVRDINPEQGPERSSRPSLVSAGDDHVLFFAVDEDHGRELWSTDGSAAGTRLIRDLCPGECSSLSEIAYRPRLGDRFVFSVKADFFGQSRLWASDGTWQGTVLLASPLLDFTAVGVIEDRGLLLLAESDRIGDQETSLWVTDGTPAGTRRLGDGPDGRPLRSVGYSVGAGSVIFAGYRPETGFEPWVSDGTEAGTRLVADLDPGPAVSFPVEVRRLPVGTVFFTNFSSDPCSVLFWVSDGTAAGTRSLMEFERCGSPPRTPQTLGTDTAVYFLFRWFNGPRELWRSDGTRAGTRLLTSFEGEAFSAGATAGVGDAVYFAADDGVHGMEPWVADAVGARMIADLCPGTCSSTPESLAWLGGALYFRADNGVYGAELWRSDGTPAGTRLVADACPGPCGSFVVPMAATAAGRVFFVTDFPFGTGFNRTLWASDGTSGQHLVTLPDEGDSFAPSHATLDGLFLFDRYDVEHGRELWRSDGTPEGTELIADILGGRLTGAGSNPELMTPWGNRVFFFASDPDDGYQPWVSDGTPDGTRRLGVVLDPADQQSNQFPYGSPVTRGSDAFFLAGRPEEEPDELWRSSLAGPPERLLDLPGDLTGTRLVRLGNRVVLFDLGDSDRLGGVWASDGSAAGTQLLRELNLLGATEGPGVPTGELAGRLYFAATEDLDSFDYELWRTDGTAAGTVLVKDIAPGEDPSLPEEFVRLGGLLLFAATTDDLGRQLWRTDGTAAGTRPVRDLAPGSLGLHPRALTLVGDRVFFFGSTPSGNSVWTTDGTAAGTTRVATVPDLEPFPTLLPRQAAGGNRFFFLVENEDLDLELWATDGTAAGTASVQRLLPEEGRVFGVWSGDDHAMVSFNVAGRAELWETDGTFLGTRRLVSLPDAGFQQPIEELAAAGSLLFFRGRHPEAGIEPMALRLGPPAPCTPDADTLCLRDGRFAVRVRWRDPRSNDEGTAGALPLPGSDRSGLFWFFHPDNVELVVKVLDAGAVNGYIWNFYGALSDVEYWVEVTDTATGRRVEYHNPEGEICGRGDTRAFPARGVGVPVPRPIAARAIAAAGTAGGAACGGGPAALCLLGDRFRVEVEWTDQRSGDSGVGTGIPGTDRSGFFWFFEPQNIELVVKVLDGREVNGKFWVFYGALSDVEYTITVTDTETGEHAEYHNPPGEICGRGDTAAF